MYWFIFLERNDLVTNTLRNVVLRRTSLLWYYVWKLAQKLLPWLKTNVIMRILQEYYMFIAPTFESVFERTLNKLVPVNIRKYWQQNYYHYDFFEIKLCRILGVNVSVGTARQREGTFGLKACTSGTGSASLSSQIAISNRKRTRMIRGVLVQSLSKQSLVVSVGKSEKPAPNWWWNYSWWTTDQLRRYYPICTF